LQEQFPDLIILDVWLPEWTAYRCCRRSLPQERSTCDNDFRTRHIEVAVKATRIGAYDFLEKPLSLERVVLSVRRALERSALEKENRDLKENSQENGNLLVTLLR